jgi:arylsulfatase A
LIPILTGSGTLQRESLFFHYPNYAFHNRNRLGGAIRKGDYKLIHFYDDDSVELYDVVVDQGEKNNLAPSKPKLAREMRVELGHWLKESGAKMPYVVDTKSKE